MVDVALSDSSDRLYPFVPPVMETVAVVVATPGTPIPGVNDPSETVEDDSVSVRDADDAVVKELHAVESVKVFVPSGSFADARHQYWVPEDKDV